MWEKILVIGIVLSLLIAIGGCELGTTYEAGVLAGGTEEYSGTWPGWDVVNGAMFFTVVFLFMLLGHALGKTDAKNEMKETRK